MSDTARQNSTYRIPRSVLCTAYRLSHREKEEEKSFLTTSTVNETMRKRSRNLFEDTRENESGSKRYRASAPSSSRMRGGMFSVLLVGAKSTGITMSTVRMFHDDSKCLEVVRREFGSKQDVVQQSI